MTNTAKFKILTHFLKGKISFTPLEMIINVLGGSEYLEVLVKLAKRRKDEEKQVAHCYNSCYTHHKMGEYQ